MSLTRSPFVQSRTEGGVGPLVLSDPRFFGAGNVFFVQSTHSNAGDSAGKGQTPDAPFATLDYAVGQCTANQGDLIVALPGHVETLTAAGGLDLDVAGITILGIGNGSLQPKVVLGTATTTDVDIDAANITIENLQFVANFADIAAALDVNADDFTVRRCRFLAGGADLNARIWIQDAAAGGSDRITVEDCYCLDRDAANTHFINLAGTGDGHVIRRNILLVDCGTAVIGGAGVVTNVTITDNRISNAATDVDSGIALAATATGLLSGNHVAIALAGDATTGIDADACGMIQNFVVDTGDRQGVLDPAAT